MNARELLSGVERIADPVVLVDRVLRAGLLLHASDVYFDPGAVKVRVRFRIDGELEDVLEFPAAISAAVTSRLKVLSELDIAERRAPQDGGFTWRMPGDSARRYSALDIRTATLPVRHGERVTLRLLEKDGARLTLDRLGFSAQDLAVFDRILREPHGLVLLTGPTGSGKTTTLYAAIQELLKMDALNIITVEDPIEYEIPGVVQAEVDSSDKVNFAKALKSILRHDPDVVMIGEIRDSQSLDTAVKSALTGHLVLSTLHANDAKSVPTRLADMGLEKQLIGATLRLAVAQRLVRRVCVRCGGKGCQECGGKGLLGRIGLFELYAPDGTIATSMRADAEAKIAAGLTTVGEVARALGGD